MRRPLPLLPALALALLGACANVSDRSVTAPGLDPGTYLVAVDTADRTYLDYVTIGESRTWSPERDGWPLLARWDGAAAATAVRFLRFTPGDAPDPARIMELLPRTAPAARSLDITAAPYSARPSPADATAAIRAALSEAARMARPGDPVDVVVPAGSWSYGEVLEVGPWVRLRGIDGGTLVSSRPDAAAVHLAGSGSGALFLRLQGSATGRGSTPDTCGIWVGPRTSSQGEVHDTLVVGNEIIQPSGAHVFAIAEVGGIWAFNFAHGGFADAYHHTGRSRGCQVVANRAQESAARGDDLYAFVGYASNGDPVHHCSCIANWGRDGAARGLAAVGAGFIAFQDNDVARTQAAGIYLAREASYDTYGTFSIEVRRNRIEAANLSLSHDGLLAYSSTPDATAATLSFGELSSAVEDLTVVDNTFVDVSPGIGNGYGIEIRSSCRRGRVQGNRVIRARAPGVVVQGTDFEVGGNEFQP